jgi:hypothetical protein
MRARGEFDGSNRVLPDLVVFLPYALNFCIEGLK